MGSTGPQGGPNTGVIWLWIAVFALLVALGSLSHARADPIVWKPEVIDGLSMMCDVTGRREEDHHII